MIYVDFPQDAETISDTSNYELDIPLTKEKNKKLIRRIKNKLVKTNLEFAAKHRKTYSKFTTSS